MTIPLLAARSDQTSEQRGPRNVSSTVRMVQRSAHRICLGATPRPHGGAVELGGPSPGRLGSRSSFAR
jgi:hypothetical protein